MLSPEADAQLRAKNFVPFGKEFTSLGFEPTQAAIECPWALAGAAVGDADVYYGWAAFAPGEKDGYLQLVKGLGYGTRGVDGGVMLVAPPSQEGGGGPLDFMVTDEWVAFGPAGRVTDIVWAR
jgi:hypothetical protein